MQKKTVYWSWKSEFILNLESCTQFSNAQRCFFVLISYGDIDIINTIIIVPLLPTLNPKFFHTSLRISGNDTVLKSATVNLINQLIRHDDDVNE